MIRFLFVFLLLHYPLSASLLLKENLKQAIPGDYIVTVQGKTHTLLLIQGRDNGNLSIEEISIPSARIPSSFDWKNWVSQEAPNNSSWVRYTIDTNSAQMLNFYSFTKKNWYKVSEADNFLSKLLTLQLEEVPKRYLKKVGPRPPRGTPDRRPYWQPRMIVEGKEIANVNFTAWKTCWPRDRSELSGKTIEVYLPEDNQKYPSYFPYWLQISGMIGKAKVRIIDSGFHLRSPKPSVI